MSDDIVTRLYAYDCDGHEAAELIERLRTALRLAAGLLSSCAPYDQMHPDRVLELLTDERDHDHHESAQSTQTDQARCKRLPKSGLSLPNLHARLG